MNIAEDAIEVDGKKFDLEQVKKAVRATYQLAFTYALADSRNAGAEDIRWESLDSIADLAHEALGVHKAAVDREAYEQNTMPGERYYVEPDGGLFNSIFPEGEASHNALHSSVDGALAHIQRYAGEQRVFVVQHPKQALEAEAAVRDFAFGDLYVREVRGPLRLNPEIQADRKKADDTEGGDLD